TDGLKTVPVPKNLNRRMFSSLSFFVSCSCPRTESNRKVSGRVVSNRVWTRIPKWASNGSVLMKNPLSYPASALSGVALDDSIRSASPRTAITPRSTLRLGLIHLLLWKDGKDGKDDRPRADTLRDDDEGVQSSMLTLRELDQSTRGEAVHRPDDGPATNRDRGTSRSTRESDHPALRFRAP